MTTRPPRELGPSGRKAWRAVTAVYELDPGELIILAELCATADLIARLAAELDAAGVMTTGSMGQPVLHPAAEELRLSRRLLADLTARLALPDQAGDTVADPVRRAAAVLRWKARDGKTA